ncbi:cysteine desulfurase-like protein [Parasalinivibrio latis]|uniref:cysteine desulfurase-like protein n=1 Tax=Parasalinivibrio latis TaxID=2952610 RepID=UPI0030E1C9A9
MDMTAIRAQFPAVTQHLEGKPVYFFDGPGGAQVPISVLNAMTDYLKKGNANLGGRFFSGYQTDKVMGDARVTAARFLNAPSENNIVFGANMTSLSFSLSRAISRDWQKGDEVIVSALDHYSNVSSWEHAAKDKGVVVKKARVNPDGCTIDLEHLKSLLSGKTKLVAFTLASNVTGTLVDAKSIIQAAKSVGAVTFIDAVHYAPHNLVDVQHLECDFLLCSAYKFYGPHLGIAFVSEPWLTELIPYKVEPATDIGPGRFETGTQSFEALAGFVETVDYLASLSGFGEEEPLRDRLELSFQKIAQHEERLSERFLRWVETKSHIKLYGLTDSNHHIRTPTFAFTVSKMHPSDVAVSLGQKNMCVWAGHFYAQGLIEQLGLMDFGGVVRVGFMHYNTLDEVDALCMELDTFIS